ncbi:MAG: Flagellar hook-length control protein FliK [Candidatus Tokpelaia sp. JSC188]|nr:MAG: Flagellar hook-length control protein FliK [Candidatus Tokpelaia sp. JSC188]
MTMETLNTATSLCNSSTKLPNKNSNSISCLAERVTDFEKLIKQSISSDQMYSNIKDSEVVENLEMEDQGKDEAINMPVQIGIGDVLLAYAVLQQTQKTDRMLQMNASEIEDGADNTSLLDMDHMGAAGKIIMLGQNESMFTTGVEEYELNQDVLRSESQKNTIEGHHNKSPIMHTLFSDIIFDKIEMRESLKVGDKVQLKPNPLAVSQTTRIDGLEIVQNRKSGDLRILHLKIIPENLGSIEARMRMTSNGLLHIELRAEQTEVARLLAADHRMLLETLKDFGLQNHNRISVAVIDRAAHNMIHTASTVSQPGDQVFDNQYQGEHQAKPNSQDFGQNGRRFSDDSKKDFSFENREIDDLAHDDNAYHNPYYLII